MLRWQKFFVLVVILLWGSATVLSALALEEIGPLAVSFWRWVWALPVLWAVLWASPERSQIGATLRGAGPAIVAVGFSGIAALYAFQNLALKHTTAFNVSLLIEMTPIFIAMLALVFLHEYPSWRTWLGIGLGFGGAVLLALNGWQGHEAVGRGSLLGDVLALGAALAGAVYTVHGKHLLQRMSPLMMLTLSATAGVFMLLPLVWWEGNFWPQSPQVWGLLVVLGVGAGALGNLWWFRELEHRQAAQLGVVLFLTALTAAALAVLILGDPLTPWLIAGGMLILLGARLVK